MYQSGWTPFVPQAGVYGPYCQIGIDLDKATEHEHRTRNPRNSPRERSAYAGHMGEPTTFASRRSRPRNCV